MIQQVHATIAMTTRSPVYPTSAASHADYSPEYEDRLNSLEKYLNEPKNEAMEGFYWELAGAGDPGEGSQLLLVGMMTDEALLK